ncbi:MAG: hypothetical protein M1383_01595 [Patescibacteria group bacterium]|nr:hypothetical protein [Patescibacteria group bacterium]
MKKKRLWFVLLFAVLGLAALQVPLFAVVGSSTKFTLFDLFGPIASGFLGTIPGILAVFLMQIFNFFAHGFSWSNTAAVIRIFPMVFGALYFSRKSKLNIIVPLLAILAWNLTPAGRAAWFYSLFWIIPIACYFLQEKYLLARSLGATFTAHAAGGALWIYFLPLPKAVWLTLIPTTSMERAIFALGIAGMYLAFNNAINFLAQKHFPKLGVLVNPRYAWKWKTA